MRTCDCKCVDRPGNFTPSPDTICAMADDHRLCEMPARFRWAMQWAAGEIDRLRQRVRLADAALRSDPPKLTAEEWEAVRFFSLIDGPGNVPVANRRAATLRGLLERTK